MITLKPTPTLAVISITSASTAAKAGWTRGAHSKQSSARCKPPTELVVHNSLDGEQHEHRGEHPENDHRNHRTQHFGSIVAP